MWQLKEVLFRVALQHVITQRNILILDFNKLADKDYGYFSDFDY